MMKKEIKIAIAVVLSIWFFVMGFELGIYKERKANLDTTKTVVNTVAPTSSTTAPSTTIPTTVPTTVPTTAPTTLPSVITESTTAPTSSSQADSSTEASSQSASSNDPSSLSKQDVIKKVNEYMAVLKAEQNVTAHKSENITVNVTDCSVPAAIDMINNIISGLAGSEEVDYTIANGASADGESMFALIPPTNKDFLISDAGVASAVAKTSGTDTVYTVVLNAENTTAASPVPTYNSTAIGYLDLTSLNLSAVTISEANMTYPGSTVEITVNADGKVTKLVNKMPMTGYGEAQISFFSGNASFEGALDETWTFTY